MPIPEPPFELQAAHRYFAPTCFNRAWTYLDKSELSSEEAEAMLAASYASLWHWTQRDDCAPAKLAIGYWQLSRVYAVLGDARSAERYGRLSLTNASDPSAPPFCRAYAHEALARAAAAGGDRTEMARQIDEARREAAGIEKEEDKEGLFKDLAEIERAAT